LLVCLDLPPRVGGLLTAGVVRTRRLLDSSWFSSNWATRRSLFLSFAEIFLTSLLCFLIS
jgi:hypothetical protein